MQSGGQCEQSKLYRLFHSQIHSHALQQTHIQNTLGVPPFPQEGVPPKTFICSIMQGPGVLTQHLKWMSVESVTTTLTLLEMQLGHGSRGCVSGLARG